MGQRTCMILRVASAWRWRLLVGGVLETTVRTGRANCGVHRSVAGGGVRTMTRLTPDRTVRRGDPIFAASEGGRRSVLIGGVFVPGALGGRWVWFPGPSRLAAGTGGAAWGHRKPFWHEAHPGDGNFGGEDGLELGDAYSSRDFLSGGRMLSRPAGVSLDLRQGEGDAPDAVHVKDPARDLAAEHGRGLERTRSGIPSHFATPEGADAGSDGAEAAACAQFIDAVKEGHEVEEVTGDAGDLGVGRLATGERIEGLTGAGGGLAKRGFAAPAGTPAGHVGRMDEVAPAGRLEAGVCARPEGLEAAGFGIGRSGGDPGLVLEGVVAAAVARAAVLGVESAKPLKQGLVVLRHPRHGALRGGLSGRGRDGQKEGQDEEKGTHGGQAGVKEAPQPQRAVASGIRRSKADPESVSRQSRTARARKGALTGSTSTPPVPSARRMSSASGAATRTRVWRRPEQPPAVMATRRKGVSGWAVARACRRARAASVRVMAGRSWGCGKQMGGRSSIRSVPSTGHSGLHEIWRGACPEGRRRPSIAPS